MTDEHITNIYRTPVYWRSTMTYPRFGPVDARLVFFIILFAVHIKLWTAILLCIAFAVFAIATNLGYSMIGLFRAIRSAVAGPNRPAIARSRLRQFVNYDSDALRPLEFAPFVPNKRLEKLAERERHVGR